MKIGPRIILRGKRIEALQLNYNCIRVCLTRQLSGALNGPEPAGGSVSTAGSKWLTAFGEKLPRCGTQDPMWLLEDLLGSQQLRRQGSVLSKLAASSPSHVTNESVSR